MLVAAQAISQRIALISASEMLPSRSCSVAIASGEETKTEKRRHATSGSRAARAGRLLVDRGATDARGRLQAPSHPRSCRTARRRRSTRAPSPSWPQRRAAQRHRRTGRRLRRRSSRLAQPGRPAWWRTSSSRYRAAPWAPLHSSRHPAARRRAAPVEECPRGELGRRQRSPRRLGERTPHDALAEAFAAHVAIPRNRLLLDAIVAARREHDIFVGLAAS